MKISRALAGLGLALAATGSLANERVVLGFPTSPSVSGSDIFFGRQLGFFSEEGIDLQIVTFGGGGVLVPQVVNKSVTFGLLDATIPLVAYGKGDPAPVRFVYNLMRANMVGFHVLESSGITQLSELRGKTVGIMSAATGVNVLSRAAFKDVGVNWDNEVKKVPTGIGAASWRQLASGQVDALNTPFSENAKMKLAGMAVRQIPYPESLQGAFAQALFTHVDTIQQKPKLIAAMGRALAKSTIACEAAMAACVRAQWAASPESRPAPGQEKAWTDETITVLKANFHARTMFPDNKRSWGSFPAGNIDGYKAALQESGALPRGMQIADDQIFTNQFVAQFNDFDASAIVQRARKFEADTVK